MTFVEPPGFQRPRSRFGHSLEGRPAVPRGMADPDPGNPRRRRISTWWSGLSKAKKAVLAVTGILGAILTVATQGFGLFTSVVDYDKSTALDALQPMDAQLATAHDNLDAWSGMGAQRAGDNTTVAAAEALSAQAHASCDQQQYVTCKSSAVQATATLARLDPTGARASAATKYRDANAGLSALAARIRDADAAVDGLRTQSGAPPRS